MNGDKFMLKKKSGQMECSRNPGKEFTWWYYEEIPRQHRSSPVAEDIPSPQFCYEGRDSNGVPIISGYCPVCGCIHSLDKDIALSIAEEFHLY